MRSPRIVIALALLASGLAASSAVARAPGWTQLSAPQPQYGGGLADISCPAATVCFAVGFKRATSRTSKLVGLIDRWNGSSVKAQSAPAVEAQGVSCVSRAFCMEVGIKPGSATATASAKWNGRRWSALAMPAARDAYLQGISCWATNRCVAVGQTLPVSYARPLIERWNGASWRIQKSPTGSQYANHLSGVSCVSGSMCIAVGQTFLDAQGRNSKTLAERWNGRRWQIVASPTQAKTTQPWLHAIACTSASNCVAVGGGNTNSQISRWNGSQFVAETPASPPPGTEAPTLTGVSCLSATFCMAVGASNYPSRLEAEQWDGTSWTLTPLPEGSSSDNFQGGGVSCPSTTLCLADGMAFRGRTTRIIVDRWSAS